MIRSTDLPTDERFTAEFLALALQLLPVDTTQPAAAYDRSALRFTQIEPPRDPDLPLLPPKSYPRFEDAQIELAVRLLTPPPPPEGFIGRKTELDQLVSALIAGRSVGITGAPGIGKTTLLRQVAHDNRLRQQFRRVWWLSTLKDASLILALALNAPNILIVDAADQPRLIREYLAQLGVLLLIDEADDVTALAYGANTAAAFIREVELSSGVARIQLRGFDTETSATWLAARTNLPTADLTALVGLAEGHPRALQVLSTLINEDDVTPDQLESYLRSVGDDKLTALYTASLEALPDIYRTLLGLFAATPHRWINVETIFNRYENRLAGQRALRWLVRYGFLQRKGEEVRAVGEWLTLVDPADEHFEVQSMDREQLKPPSTDDEPSLRSRDMHTQGLQHLEGLRDTDADAALQEALTIRQQHKLRYGVAETQTALARLAYLRGDDAQAIRRLEAAAEILHDLRDDEGLAILRVALSRAYRRAGRLDAALQVLDEQAPLAEWAAVYRARQEWDEAIKVYQRWLSEAERDESGLLTARHGMAETLTMAGRYDEALAIIKDNRAFAMQWLKAMLLHLKGDISGALATYEQIYADAPPESRAALARSMARAKVHHLTPETAEEQVREAAMLVGAEGIWFESRLPRKIFARERLSHALYAHFCLMLDRVEAAETAARTALDIAGERPNPEAEAISHRVLGRIAYQRGQWGVAQKSFEAELNARGAFPAGLARDDSEMGFTLHALADVLRERGEVDRSIANYRRALTYKDPVRDRHSFLLTQFALRDALLTVGRRAEALEIGNHLIDLLNRPPAADLLLIGNSLAVQTQNQIDAGRAQRGQPLLADLIQRLTDRYDEALAHDYWGVRVLAAGLNLRSQPIGDITAQIELAEQSLALAEANTPDSWPAWAARRDLGKAYLRAEGWQQAIETFEPLLTLPGDVQADVPFVLLEAYLGTARALIQLDRLPEAAEHIDAAITFEPDSLARGTLLREMAEAFRAAGDDVHAIEYDQKAMTYLRTAPSIKHYADTIVALAYSRLRLRQYNEAINTFEEAISLVQNQRPPDEALLGAVLFDMATALGILGQHKRAAVTFKQSLHHQSLRADPAKYAQTLIAMARSYIAAEAYTDALPAYYDALQSDTLSKEQRRTVLIEQAGAFDKNRQPQAAIQAYKAALALEGASVTEQAIIQRGLGVAHTTLGDHETARGHFTAVLATETGEQAGLTWQAIADGHRIQKQPDEAINAYLKALETLDRAKDPMRIATVQRALADLYLETNHLAETVRHAEIALEIERSQFQQNGARIIHLLQVLAEAHERRGELDRATHRYHEVLVFQDARTAPEDYIATLLTLGRLYTTLKRYREAIKAFDESMNVLTQQPSPDRTRVETIRRNLADCYYALGKLETAADLYRQTAKLPTASPVREAAREALRNVEAEINKHLQTLEVAEQSWTLFRKGSRPDVTELVFVRALQAHTSAALGRDDDVRKYTAMMLQLVKDRRHELSSIEPRPVIQALSAWLQAQEADEIGDPRAAEHYRQAAEIVESDPKANASLRWVIEQRGKR